MPFAESASAREIRTRCPMCTNLHMHSMHIILGTSSYEAENCPGAHFTQTAAVSLSLVLDPGRTLRKNRWWHNSDVSNPGSSSTGWYQWDVSALIREWDRQHLQVPTGYYPPCEYFHPPGLQGRTLYLDQYLQGLETRQALAHHHTTVKSCTT